MILSTLRYAGYCWPHNPLKIYADHKLIAQTETTLDAAVRVVSAASDLSRISGEGEIVGKDCVAQWKALEKLFERHKKGVLCLPGFEPFTAYFTKLCVVGDATPDLLRYTFEFMRCNEEQLATFRYHICKQGETLFDIAYDYGCDVDALVRLNPRIKSPLELSEGTRVRIC